MEQVMHADIVVVGAGPGGLSAAISAARQGADVLLVERLGYLGGCLAMGLPLLGYYDAQERFVSGGFAQELVERLRELNGATAHRICPMHNSTTLIDPSITKILCFQMAQEAGVRLLLHCELADAVVENGAIREITVVGKGQKIHISGKVFIDGTGDGDLAYLCGCRYEKGQAGTGEMQSPTLTFDLGGVELPRLFDYLEEHPGDFQYCDTMEVKPGYNTAHLRGDRNHVFIGMRETLARLKQEGKCPIKRDTLIYINQMNPGHVVINSIRILDFDGSDVQSLTDGETESYLTILPLIKMLRENIPGFENCYLSHINPVIGVRESRRIQGIRTLTAEDVLAGSVPQDSICLGSFKIDIHAGATDSTIFKYLDHPYGIPYGCAVSADVTNLMMAGRCISVDAVAFGSIRIMPTCMGVGQGAGVGAALAVREGIAPGAVDVQKIRDVLLKSKAILEVEA